MGTKLADAKHIEYTINWRQYLRDLEDLAIGIYKSKPIIDGIYGIPRGGLIPATILSHKLNIPIITREELEGWYMRVRGCVLIVDDLSDTGDTFIKLIDKIHLTNRADWFLTACPYYKKGTKFQPNYAIRAYDKLNWIIFPYEHSIVAKHQFRYKYKEGIMHQIRQFVDEGLTIKQIVAKGYNIGTVRDTYRKQMLRRRVKANQDQINFNFYDALNCQGPVGGVLMDIENE